MTTLFTQDTPINRAEEATTITLIAKEYETPAHNITANVTVSQVTLVVRDMEIALQLCQRLRFEGWHRSTILTGRYTNRYFVQVPYNAFVVN